MKNKRTPQKKSFPRQLISGAVYTALASVVVAVTVNTTIGLLQDRNLPLPESSPENINTTLPSVPDIPKLKLPELDAVGEDISDSRSVSDTAEGVTDIITEAVPENTADTQITPLDFEIPEDANLGIDRFIKPCDGYVLKEHSADVPVYSATMSDYRIHIGVDVTGDIGTPVAAVCGGIVTDILDDDLYGKTVCVKARDGYLIRYSNLLPDLNAQISVGETVATGDIIGGIGDTALCEAVDSSHLHLEIFDADGNGINPEDLISF